MSTFTNIEVYSISDGLDSFFDDIQNRLLPIHIEQDISFDEIRIELWGDSGRLVAFPASKESAERTEISGTQLISQELLNFVDSLSESKISDSEFEKQIETHYEQILDLLINSAQQYPTLNFTLYSEDGEIIGGTSQIPCS